MSEFHCLLDAEKPDTIAGKESWLSPDISNSEVFLLAMWPSVLTVNLRQCAVVASLLWSVTMSGSLSNLSSKPTVS